MEAGRRSCSRCCIPAEHRCCHICVLFYVLVQVIHCCTWQSLAHSSSSLGIGVHRSITHSRRWSTERNSLEWFYTTFICIFLFYKVAMYCYLFYRSILGILCSKDAEDSGWLSWREENGRHDEGNKWPCCLDALMSAQGGVPLSPYTALLPPSLYEDFSTWMQHLSPIIIVLSFLAVSYRPRFIALL